MLINIDDELITPRVRALIREFVDRVDSAETVTENGDIYLRRNNVRYIIVAKSYYKAYEYIHRKRYVIDECAIVIASIDGHFMAPNYPKATVEIADYYVI